MYERLIMHPGLLPEEAFHPFENILVLDRLRLLERGLRGQLLDEFSLLGREFRRNGDVHHRQFVAATVAVGNVH